MSPQSIWYAEQVNLEALFISNPSLETEFEARKKVIKKGNYIYLPEEVSNKIYFIYILLCVRVNRGWRV